MYRKILYMLLTFFMLIITLFPGVSFAANIYLPGGPTPIDNGDGNVPTQYELIEAGDGTDQWNDLIVDAADAGGVHPVILKAIMMQESGGAEKHSVPNCPVNATGDSGLMQINNTSSGLNGKDEFSVGRLCEPLYSLWASIEVIKIKANMMLNVRDNGSKPAGCDTNSNHEACGWEPQANLFYVLWGYNGYSLSSLDNNNYAFEVEKHIKSYGIEAGGALKYPAFIDATRASLNSNGRYSYTPYSEFEARVGQPIYYIKWKDDDFSGGYVTDEESYRSISDYYSNLFDRIESKIKNTGLDNRKSDYSSTTSYISKLFLGDIANFLFNLARVLCVLIIGVIILIWLLAVLGYSGIIFAYELLIKLSKGKIDIYKDGMGKLFKYTGFAFLVCVVVISGLLPKIFALIYGILANVFEFLSRINPF